MITTLQGRSRASELERVLIVNCSSRGADVLYVTVYIILIFTGPGRITSEEER